MDRCPSLQDAIQKLATRLNSVVEATPQVSTFKNNAGSAPSVSTTAWPTRQRIVAHKLATIYYATSFEDLAPLMNRASQRSITHVLLGLFHLGYTNKMKKTGSCIRLNENTPLTRRTPRSGEMSKPSRDLAFVCWDRWAKAASATSATCSPLSRATRRPALCSRAPASSTAWMESTPISKNLLSRRPESATCAAISRGLRACCRRAHRARKCVSPDELYRPL